MARTLASELDGPGVTKLVLVGDFLGGSLFASSHRGESVIEVLNAMRLDYCVLGNHEFDYGADRTRELMDKSEFPWLGSNVREAGAPDRPLFHSLLDVDVLEVPVGGSTGVVRVGVFGLCTPATPNLSSPGPSVAFEEPVAHAQRCVATLQQRGCELIIALTHLSLAQDKELAEACPGIRVMLGGHDHDPFLLVHRGTLIAKCGQNADHLGVLDLHLERPGAGLPLLSEHSFSLLSTWGAPADPRVAAAAARWRDGDAKEGALCHIGDVDLSTRTQELRTSENAFGCYVADAMRWSFREQGCEAAIINGGFVRQDGLYPAHTHLTASQVREELPFDRRAVLLRLPGQLLLRGLEEMLASLPAAAGSFPQLSGGLRVAFSPGAPKLGRVRRVSVGGQELELQREYLVAVSDFFTAKAGDSVEAFAAGRPVGEPSEVIRCLAVEYLSTLGSITGEQPGRLIAFQEGEV